MNSIVFKELADYLRDGREIELAYGGRQYSITNHSGFWHLCDDTEHALLETICPFEEKETLISKVAVVSLAGLTVQQIFDTMSYDPEKLCIL